MAQVVCLHGIAQQYETEDTLHRRWAPALRGGVRLAGGSLAESDISCVAYGDLFRAPGRRLAPGDDHVRPTDLDDFEQALLLEWWQEAARIDRQVTPPGSRTLARTPNSVQGALRALSGSRFFSGLSERALLGDLRQVRRYLHDSEIRRAVQKRVASVINDEVKVVVAHSLGSVVAYEALCANPQWPLRALVTLGSPLAIPHLILARLIPPPQPESTGPRTVRGRWPGQGRSWTNVADEGDVVALVKDLRPAFGPDVACWLVDNGAKPHDVKPYLTARETGAAVMAGLG